MISAKTGLCCIIGHPVTHSLSPQMQNAAFKKEAADFTFMAFEVTDLYKAVEGLRAINCRCIVVTIPFKVEVLKYADQTDDSARKIGAANCLINKNGFYKATNTDWYGAIRSLEEVTSLKNKKVAILGAGGAARAIIYGMKLKKADITLFNRTGKRAEKLAREFNLSDCFQLNEQERLKNMDIIINATSVGMAPNSDETPLNDGIIQPNQIVFDIVYTPHITKLLKMAIKSGATAVYGYRMVLYGGIKIFELITGKKAPIKIMEETLKKNLHG